MTTDDTMRSERRDALKKIVAGGAVIWAAPMISKTAGATGLPSGCVPQELNWNTFAAGTPFSSTTVGGVDISVSSSFYGGSAARATNRTIVAGPQGGIPGNFLRLEQDAVTNGGQNVTMTFSQPVRNVSFMITDIDNTSNAWADRVTVNTAGFTSSIPSGSSVIGIGANGNGTGGTTSDGNGGSNTGTGAFRNSSDGTNFDNSQPGGNLRLTFAGPISSLSFSFWCGGYQGSNQLINIGAVAFDPCP